MRLVRADSAGLRKAALLAIFALLLSFPARGQYMGGSIPIVSTFDHSSQIVVADTNEILGVQVTLIGLSHGRSGDLIAGLSHRTTNNVNIPVTLFSRPGVDTQAPFGATSTTSGNYGFSDSASNTFSAAAIAAGGGVVPNDIYHPCDGGPDPSNYPLTYLSNFVGSAAAGTWEVDMSDGGPGIDGTLDGWQLDILTRPQLSIFLPDTNTAVVWWPPVAPGFILQGNFDLKTTNWVTVTNPVVQTNGSNFVTFAPPISNRFFRLFHP